jgi:hypothetical protein
VDMQKLLIGDSPHFRELGYCTPFNPTGMLTP